MNTGQDKSICFFLPHQLGKLCLILRLLKTARQYTNPSQVWYAYSPNSMASAIKELQLFEHVYNYENTQHLSVDKIIDLTSYDYSYQLAEVISWQKIVRRNLDSPWLIHFGSKFNMSIENCPALEPKKGWFDIDTCSNAMLCELPVINLGLGYDIQNQFLMQSTLKQEPFKWPQVFNYENGKQVLLLMGGGHPGKHYPLKYWSILAKYFQNQKWRVVTLLGPDEKLLLPEIESEGLQTVYSDSLEKTINLINKYELIIGNDCGAMHVALLFGKTTIGIFGPTVPESWFAYTTKKQISIQQRQAILARGDILKDLHLQTWPLPEQVFECAIELSDTDSTTFKSIQQRNFFPHILVD